MLRTWPSLGLRAFSDMSVLCLGQSKVSHILLPLACYPRSLAFTLFRVHAPTWVPSVLMPRVGLSPLDCPYLFSHFYLPKLREFFCPPVCLDSIVFFFFLDVLPVSHIMFSFYFCAVRILSRIQASKRIKRHNYFRLFLLSSHLGLLLSLELGSVGRYRK